jgi:hypothetical protein
MVLRRNAGEFDPRPDPRFDNPWTSYRRSAMGPLFPGRDCFGLTITEAHSGTSNNFPGDIHGPVVPVLPAPPPL